MPEQQILAKNYLSLEILEKVGDYSPDCALFTGFEQDDVVYYRRNRFSKEDLDYLDFRKNLLKETWIDVPNFDALPFTSFASLKWIIPEYVSGVSGTWLSAQHQVSYPAFFFEDCCLTRWHW